MVICATGVYGKTEHEFFDSLLSENITLFVDIRQRRGMRGKKYSFVNSLYLQDILDSFNYDQILQLIKREKIVFFCVEKDCNACHRSLLLKRLKEGFDINGYCF